MNMAASEGAQSNGLTAYMLDQINIFCHQLVNPSTEKVKDMSLWFNYLSYDIMGELVFGRGFGMLTDTSLRYILDLIDSTVFSYLLVSGTDCLKGGVTH